MYLGSRSSGSRRLRSARITLLRFAPFLPLDGVPILDHLTAFQAQKQIKQFYADREEKKKQAFQASKCASLTISQDMRLSWVSLADWHLRTGPVRPRRTLVRARRGRRLACWSISPT